MRHGTLDGRTQRSQVVGQVFCGQRLQCAQCLRTRQIELLDRVAVGLDSSPRNCRVIAIAFADALAEGLIAQFGPEPLRLARAEARAAGGDLVRTGDRLVLDLPGLTVPADRHSQAV